MKALRDRIIKPIPKICNYATVRSNSTSLGRKKQIFCIAYKRKMRANQLLPSFPYMKVELTIHSPAEVTAVRYFELAKTSYAICPSCSYSLEREYQKYCDQCGQLLAWNLFRNKKILVERIVGNHHASKDLINR